MRSTRPESPLLCTKLTSLNALTLAQHCPFCWGERAPRGYTQCEQKWGIMIFNTLGSSRLSQQITTKVVFLRHSFLVLWSRDAFWCRGAALRASLFIKARHFLQNFSPMNPEKDSSSLLADSRTTIEEFLRQLDKFLRFDFKQFRIKRSSKDY